MLAQIEALDSVDEAWMSQDGTIVVLVPATSVPLDAPAIETMLSETGDAPTQLVGVNLTTALGLFAERDGWVRAGSAEVLTAEEAVRVAARLRARVEAAVAISDDAGDAMEAVIRRRFVEAVASGDWDGQFRATMDECAAFLSADGLAALEQAIALGIEPQPGEK